MQGNRETLQESARKTLREASLTEAKCKAVVIKAREGSGGGRMERG